MIIAAVRYPRPPEPQLTVDLAERPRAHLPVAAVVPGSFKPTQVGFDEATAHAEASRCFRCDAVYRCAGMTVVAGRGARHPLPMLPPGAAGPAAQPQAGDQPTPSVTGGQA